MDEPVRVLSIDGGGMRGIIPAMILAEIEHRCGKPISRLFDLIVGTSTGGILALGLAKPGNAANPDFVGKELTAFYTHDGSTVFPGGGPASPRERVLGRGDTLIEKMTNSALRMGSLSGGNPRFAGNARYFPRGLERVLEKVFGSNRLSDASVEVAIPTYDTLSGSAVLLSRSDARRDPQSDILMKDAARATSAAPTFFPPLQISWNGRECSFIDGGVWANNPSLVALAESLRLTAERSLTGTSVILVSLGTGAPPPTVRFDPHSPWLSTLRDMIAMGTTTDDAHRIIERTLGAHGSGKYWRFQVMTPEVAGTLDDATPERIGTLCAAARTLISEMSSSIDSFTEVLA
jgi:uncharacterized protein